MKKIVVLALAALSLAGCVATKKYDSMRAQAMRAERDAQLANSTITDLEAERDRLQASVDDLTAKLDSLEGANTKLAGDYAALRSSYDKMLENASAEAARMLRQLEANQKELDANKRELADRLAKVNELEAALAARDAALENIKNKVSDALLGFQGKGLSITQRDGKVYVSMEDKLLFRSGSYEIDPNGAQAVRDLSGVLAANPDISIVVEGHTDTVPYRQGSGQLRDNLDLSVMRATTVTRLLLENKGLAPGRVMSAGMGEWMPVDPANTDAARAKNRRTEIILTPKLGELLQITQ